MHRFSNCWMDDFSSIWIGLGLLSSTLPFVWGALNIDFGSSCAQFLSPHIFGQSVGGCNSFWSAKGCFIYSLEEELKSIYTYRFIYIVNLIPRNHLCSLFSHSPWPLEVISRWSQSECNSADIIFIMRSLITGRTNRKWTILQMYKYRGGDMTEESDRRKGIQFKSTIWRIGLWRVDQRWWRGGGQWMNFCICCEHRIRIPRLFFLSCTGLQLFWQLHSNGRERLIKVTFTRNYDSEFSFDQMSNNNNHHHVHWKTGRNGNAHRPLKSRRRRRRRRNTCILQEQTIQQVVFT